MDTRDLRYIVFMLNPELRQHLDGRRIDVHDGYVFKSLEQARDYAQDCLDDKLCTRFVIGVFINETDKYIDRMYIDCVETFGFKHDKKKTDQLELFKK